MKKIYSLMLALFATLCVGTAYAEDPDEGTLSPITITLNVNDPAAVQIFANGNWSSPITLTAGNNLLTINPQEDWMGPYYPDVTLQVAEGFGVNGITASAAGVPSFYLQYAGVYMLSPSELSDGVTYTITTFAYADMRKDSVIVLIDDKSKATVAYGNGQGIVLDSTFNVVYFSTEESIADLPLIVRSAGYNSYLYKVTLNDSVITDYGRGYQMYDVESGDTIQISANAPAGLEFPVIFQWADGADKDALDSLQVDGVTVDYKDTISVPWGKEVTMWLNAKEYLVKVNNSTVSQYNNNYSELILDTTVWEISSAKYEDFDVTVIAHNAGCIEIQKSIDYSKPELVEGENTISLNTLDSRIYIRRTENCVIDSVKVNGKLEESFSSILCEKNMTIEIWGDSIRRDQTFMLYLDTVANYQYTIRTATSTYLAYYYSGPYLKNGYNQFAFANADNPINFSVGYGGNPVCYQNDSIVTLSWGSCSLKLANNDVVKVFADTAEVFEVNMFVEDGVAVTDITKDRIVPIVDWTNPVSVLQNTEISFKTDAEVKVNGEVVSSEAGVITLVIEKNTTILVGDAEPTGMENAVIGNKAEKFVRDGQLIIRMNGVEYNVLGAKIQ